MKRILLVTDVFGWGGHVRAEYIKKHLSDEFHFDIIDGEGFQKYSKFTDKDIFTQTDVDNFREVSFDKKFLSLNELRKYCNRKKNDDSYDLIYLLFHTMLLRKDVRRLLRKGRKILTIVTGYPVLRASFISHGTTKAKMIFTEEANRCVGIIANNYKSLQDLKTIYKGRTFYAPRGVDETVFYPTKKFIKKNESEYTVAYVGKPVPEKGLEDIIKPACQLAGVKLIANTRNYTDALTPNEMNDFYNQSDAYLVASTIDGTPNPALEAAACGLPLVVNNIGNMPELIKDNINGFLIKDLSVRKYAHRLEWMKKNQRKAWDIGQKGRETILKDWTWKKVLNENERMIFRECLK